MTKSEFISDDYKPTGKPFDDVEEVLAKLTDKQKCQLLAGKDFWTTNAVPELNVPSIRVSDGPNGIRGRNFFRPTPAACFPCGTALGSTWDTELLERAGKLMAVEAKAKGAHVILGPTLNIQRSPLGGRGFESFSEDSVLSGLSAGAISKGIQSEGIQATLKHFVCNDQEHERNSVNVLVTERALREIYLLPFQLAIRDGAPGAIMTAYNKVNGISASQNAKLLKNILRDEWKWDGLVMSDWFGVYSVADSVKNGLDLEMPGPSNWRGRLLEGSLVSKQIAHHEVDERVRQVLKFVQRAHAESGIPEDAPEITRDTPETRRLLREIAADSIVVLKNENNVLPLSKNKKTAVIGPNGKITTYCGGGSASLKPYYTVSPFEGISQKLSETPLYTLGVNTFKELPLIGKDLVDPRGNVGFEAKVYDGPRTDKGRKHLDTYYLSDSHIFMPDYAPTKEFKAFYFDIEGYLTPESDGTYIFGVTVSGTAKLYIDDQLVVDNETKQTKGTSFFNCGTIEEKNTIELKKGQKYKINLFYGSSHTSTIEQDAGLSFGGGIRLGYIKQVSVEDEIRKAVEIAQSVDQVILTLGLNSDWESEGYDRDSMAYPPNVDALVKAVRKVNKNIVVVNQSGTPVTLDFHNEVPAIVQAWYGGNETGNAIADVIFGDVNPSGKLPLTYPDRLEDNPAYLSFRAENGRTLYSEDVYVGYKYYDTVKTKPLYPFGHGLSYTTFDYGKAKAKVVGDNVIITIDVTNSGNLDGKETVQAYISQAKPSIRRPVKELKGFTKLSIPAGQTKQAEITIPIKYATSYWHEIRDQWISEADDYTVHIGQSSESIVSTTNFSTEKTFFWSGI
ncbi:hypothetical protein AWJ20_3051 [Sugiyamaella lignohabitans]|uniref:beta-glucosidase n=1 Tax=Sugiyamaella lignohabitans TaxID=796027 RepID=A0A167FKR5_9ASCO|nr:uncharacterized protein AWJ20_3051 [Sugiyamaella lignohabitans]ANB15424.1 hypothetical protein AWJ20_3051 [Sugiyamaella lignohabitans]